ncbi:MAG: GTP-dependent dephospho-CoA kinase family protein [Candidatus Hadarchaeum sp.]|uniref:GTP-dependent dephospho-CoA kinase family protein n=2 Tax=Candidatus Hadarchaeum sp. TaxID=2883567 RepID=UPI0031711951
MYLIEVINPTMLIRMLENRILKLPESLRPRLQRPLGILYTNLDDVFDRLRRIRPNRLITVGDMVTYGFLIAGFKPDIAVIDLVIMRTPAGEEIKSTLESFEAKVIQVRNPAASISPELWKAVESAKPPTKIIVEGEEDLATIPAVLTSQDGSVVVYGQPRQGVVLIEVDEKKRQEFREILSQFEG